MAHQNSVQLATVANDFEIPSEIPDMVVNKKSLVNNDMAYHSLV